MTDDEARALDRQVALALGYTEDVFDYAYGGDSDRIVKASCWSLPDGRHTYQGSLPHFSTDIAIAFTVLEELRRRGLWWMVDADDDRYQISIILPARDPKLPDWGQAMDEWTAAATTLPEAICRAAVKALEAECDE